ncbi:MAG: hypothetical protein CMH61_02600 [Nanoarchaeota archaeon]|nr:hypothetical protein [Nanoarchaeota archaeon]
MRLLDEKDGHEAFKDFNIVEAELEDNQYRLAIEGSLKTGDDLDKINNTREFLNVLYGVINSPFYEDSQGRNDPFTFVKGSWTSDLVEKLRSEHNGHFNVAFKNIRYCDKKDDPEYVENDLKVIFEDPKSHGIRISRTYSGDSIDRFLSTVRNDYAFSQIRGFEEVRINTETDEGLYEIEFRPLQYVPEINVQKAIIPVDGTHFRGYQKDQSYSRNSVDASILTFAKDLRLKRLVLMEKKK